MIVRAWGFGKQSTLLLVSETNDDKDILKSIAISIGETVQWDADSAWKPGDAVYPGKWKSRSGKMIVLTGETESSPGYKFKGFIDLGLSKKHSIWTEDGRFHSKVGDLLYDIVAPWEE